MNRRGRVRPPDVAEGDTDGMGQRQPSLPLSLSPRGRGIQCHLLGGFSVTLRKLSHFLPPSLLKATMTGRPRPCLAVPAFASARPLSNPVFSGGAKIPRCQMPMRSAHPRAL